MTEEPEGRSPYEGLPLSAFWRSGVATSNPNSIERIYEPKFKIPGSSAIATAGSCFAQHIARHMRWNGYKILDVEPAPSGLPGSLRQNYGYATYSARYGNIYTVKQLLQIAREATDQFQPVDWIWEKDGRYYDALRPSVEPNGLDSPDEVIRHRKWHLSRVRRMFVELDFLIFTLGLTEMWVHRASDTVYPTAPGTIAGKFDSSKYEFRNAQVKDVVNDFEEFQTLLNHIRGGRPYKVLLTVSPVPLTATASGKHILVANTYSKSVLRTAAGQLSEDQSHIDYFPSYEIVTNPKLASSGYEENLRSVRDAAVKNVMRQFFLAHPPVQKEEVATAGEVSEDVDQVQCEEALLEAFGQ